jgi:hypothetical protein
LALPYSRRSNGRKSKAYTTDRIAVDTLGEDMGYMHIDNLYKDSRIFQFDECYALEKIHGTSAHISWNHDTEELTFFSGGESHDKFVALFDQEKLRQAFRAYPSIIVYGEAYGGKQQGMRETYGDQLKFIVFDVCTGNDEEHRVFMNVLDAAHCAEILGLEFVDYVRIPTKLSKIDEERAKPSTQAVRNGIAAPKEREGIVLRPIEEARDHRGNRIITKHKNDSFKETKTQRQVDPKKLEVLAEAVKIADEWVTEMRLLHVIDRAIQLQNENNADAGMPEQFDLAIEDTGIVISLMLEDVKREAKDEIVESKEAMKAIGSATARLFKKFLNQNLVAVQGE